MFESYAWQESVPHLFKGNAVGAEAVIVDSAEEGLCLVTISHDEPSIGKEVELLGKGQGLFGVFHGVRYRMSECRGRKKKTRQLRVSLAAERRGGYVEYSIESGMNLFKPNYYDTNMA